MKHFLVDLFRFTGARDRMRCPECKAVGTYKAHGGLLDREDVRHVRRWLCKWCGYYRGPEGRGQMCVVDETRKVWAFRYECPDGKTPKEVLAVYLNANPWRG